jgi:hypothetical protein
MGEIAKMIPCHLLMRWQEIADMKKMRQIVRNVGDGKVDDVRWERWRSKWRSK